MSVVPASGGGPLPGVSGLPLHAGDAVEVAEGGTAWVYVLDGRVRPVTAEELVTVQADDGLAMHLRLTADARRIVGRGLERWGRWASPDPWPDPQPHGDVTLLSPRRELVLVDRPTFYWIGKGSKLRLRVTDTDKVVYHSWIAEGSQLRYPPTAVSLEPETTYDWWLTEFRGGNPVSSKVHFRVAPQEMILRTEAFETSLALAEAELGSAFMTNVLRCAYYGELGAWTPFLLAAADVASETDPGPTAERIRAAGRRGMELDEDSSIYLLALLVWKRLDI